MASTSRDSPSRWRFATATTSPGSPWTWVLYLDSARDERAARSAGGRSSPAGSEATRRHTSRGRGRRASPSACARSRSTSTTRAGASGCGSATASASASATATTARRPSAAASPATTAPGEELVTDELLVEDERAPVRLPGHLRLRLHVRLRRRVVASGPDRAVCATSLVLVRCARFGVHAALRAPT